MLKWLYRVGMLIIILSSIMIIIPFAQWEICRSAVQELDPHGVGYRHCSYFIGRIEVALLLLGNVLVLTSYLLKMTIKTR